MNRISYSGMLRVSSLGTGALGGGVIIITESHGCPVSRWSRFTESTFRVWGLGNVWLLNIICKLLGSAKIVKDVSEGNIQRCGRETVRWKQSFHWGYFITRVYLMYCPQMESFYPTTRRVRKKGDLKGVTETETEEGVDRECERNTDQEKRVEGWEY